MVYNVRGHRVQLNEPDLGGSLQFRHNALGEVTRQWHQTAQEAIDFTYDDLGRLIQRDDVIGVSNVGASGITVGSSEWDYDTDPLGRDRLLVERSNPHAGGTAFERRYDYDDLGRITTRSTYIDADGPGALAVETFIDNVSYDRYGRLFQTRDASQALLSGAGLRPLYNTYLRLSGGQPRNRPPGQCRIWSAYKPRFRQYLNSVSRDATRCSRPNAIWSITRSNTGGNEPRMVSKPSLKKSSALNVPSNNVCPSPFGPLSNPDLI